MPIFIIILIASGTATDDSGRHYGEKDILSVSRILQSFEKLKTDVLLFFKLNHEVIEQRRRRIKGAFFQFMETAFKSEITTMNNAAIDVQILHTSKKIGKIGNDDLQYDLRDLVKSHGYAVESHEVITADGYLLALHKIVPSVENVSKTQAVLLHHGIFGSSKDWILLGRRKALPYILLNADFDVWLVNARGSKYSRQHEGVKLTEEEFWNFSWHEMGKYDLPAVIDYIKEKYEYNVDLHYIGHSMGSTALLVLLSIYPRYNYILKSAMLLAPMAYMYNVKGPMRLLAEFYNENENFRKYESLNFLKAHKFAPVESLPWNVVDRYCHGDRTLCMNPLLLISNGGQDITNDKLREAIQLHTPSGASMKTIFHYIQLVKSGNFQMYNLGQVKNLKKYGTEFPPIYRLNEVTLPVAVFASSDDWLATIPDIKSLIPNLQNLIIFHVVKKHDFTHTDFVWGEDANILVYYLILDTLKNNKSIKL